MRRKLECGHGPYTPTVAEVLLPGQSQPSQPCWPITFSVDMAAACILCSMPGGMSREVGSLEEALKITPSEASFVQEPSKDFVGSLQKLLHTPPSFREPQDAKAAGKAKSQGQEATYTKRVTRSMSLAASNIAAAAKKAMEATIPARRSRSAPGCPKPPTTPVANVASPARGASLQKSATQPQTSPSSQDASEQAEQVKGQQSSAPARNARSRSPVPAQQATKAKLPAKAGATSPAESLKTAEAGEKNPKQTPQQAKPQKKDSRATPKSSTSLPPPRRRSQGEEADEAGAAPPMPDPMPAQQGTTENPKPPASKGARSPVPTPESKQGKDAQKKQKQTNPKSTGKLRTPSTSLPPPRRRSPSPSTQATNASGAADTAQQAPTPRAPSKGSDHAQDSQQKQAASAKAASSAKLRTPSSSLPLQRRSPSPSTSKQGLDPSGTAPDAGRARRSPAPEEQKQGSEARGDSTAPTKFSCLAEAASAALARRSPSPAMQRLAEKVAVNSERAPRARSRSPLSKWQGAAEENSKTKSPAPAPSQLGSTGQSGQPKPQQKPGAKRASGNETPMRASRRSPSPAARGEKDAAKRKPAAENMRSDNSDRIVHEGIAALLQATQAMPKATSDNATEQRWDQPPKRELPSPGRSRTPRRSVSVSPRRLQLSDASHVAIRPFLSTPCFVVVVVGFRNR